MLTVVVCAIGSLRSMNKTNLVLFMSLKEKTSLYNIF